MKMQDENSPKLETQSSKLILSFVPIIFLIISLVFVVKVFDTSVMEGASQIALLVASAVCVFIGMLFFKVPWQSFEDGIKENIANVGTAIVMLLLIGAIGGTWMLSGVVPTMIYYGMQIVNPKVFLFICCIVSAVVWDAPEEGAEVGQGVNLPQLTIGVSEAKGVKCPRCWMHSTEAGQDDLCPRCAAVVSKLDIEL